MRESEPSRKRNCVSEFLEQHCRKQELYEPFFPASTPTVIECRCRTYIQTQGNSRTPCLKCKQLYLPCCLRVNKICIGCRSKFQDPVNFVQQTLTEVFFTLKNVNFYEQIFSFQVPITKMLAEGQGVEVRCYKPDKAYQQFRHLGTFYINDVEVTRYKPLIKCSNIKVRKDASFFLDRNYLKSGNILKLRIEKHKEGIHERYQCDGAGQSFFLGVYIVKCQTLSQLIENLGRNSFITTKQSIQKFFKSGDKDLQRLEQTIKLQCPYSCDMIRMPIRGQSCEHFQTFCLQTLYKLYSEKRKWNCPICGNQMKQFVIDSWVLQAIRHRNVDNHDFAVKFTVDGKYQWIENQDDSEYESSNEIDSHSQHSEKAQKKVQDPIVESKILMILERAQQPLAKIKNTQKPIVIQLDEEGVISQNVNVVKKSAIVEMIIEQSQQPPPKVKPPHMQLSKQKEKEKEKEKEKQKQKEKEKEKQKQRSKDKNRQVPKQKEKKKSDVPQSKEKRKKKNEAQKRRDIHPALINRIFFQQDAQPNTNLKSTRPQAVYNNNTKNKYEQEEMVIEIIDFNTLKKEKADIFVKSLFKQEKRLSRSMMNKNSDEDDKKFVQKFRRLFKMI